MRAKVFGEVGRFGERTSGKKKRCNVSKAVDVGEEMGHTDRSTCI